MSFDVVPMSLPYVIIMSFHVMSMSHFPFHIMSFHVILDCGCSVMGSVKNQCEKNTGKCTCKQGFTGEKCQICPDGSEATLEGCLNSKY
jgi:hypothetical protein